MKFIVLAVIAAAAIAVSSAGAATGKLVATDGPGFTITLKQAGKVVKTLKAGTYTITVQDKSNIHNFHLTGPGVNKLTSVVALKTYTWKVTLKKGTYKYVCDPHKTIMHGTFKVT
jgi:plastocyanin